MLAAGSLFGSPTNPRKKFDQVKIDELSESINLRGVKSPLLVRPVGDKYEIVAGERRFRAGQKVNLAEFPCIIEELADEDVLELQLIENLQREDLDPLEECEHYHRMLALAGADGVARYTVVALAEKIGKPISRVRRILKLKDLPKKMKAALAESEIGANLASLVARIPTVEMRERASQEILNGPDGIMSQREAMDLIKGEYMVELKGAPFNPDDPNLVPVSTSKDELGQPQRTRGGACDDCPMRTGNNRELYGDESRGDICTNPQCFAAKREAGWQKATEVAKAEGKKVLSDKESQQLFYYGSNDVSWNSNFLDIDKQPPNDMLRTGSQKGVPAWRKLIEGGPCKVEISVARSPRGKVIEIAPRAQLLEAAKQNGHDKLFDKNVSPSSKKSPAEQKAAKAERDKARLEAAYTAEGFAAMVKSYEDESRPVGYFGGLPEFWMIMLENAMEDHAGSDGRKLMCKMLGLQPQKTGYYEDCVRPVMDYAKKFAKDPRKLTALTVLALLSHSIRWKGIGSPMFKKFSAMAGIDLTELKKSVEDGIRKKALAAEPPYITPDASQGAATIKWDVKSRRFKIVHAKDFLEVSPRVRFCLGWNDAFDSKKRDFGTMDTTADLLQAYNEGIRQAELAKKDPDIRPDMKAMEALFETPKKAKPAKESPTAASKPKKAAKAKTAAKKKSKAA